VQRVLAEAGGVGRVGQPAAVVGNIGGADRKEGLALGQQVAVQNDLFRRFVLGPQLGEPWVRQ
jgi:hypothetical protein